jgi:hypothetical protein
MGAMGGHLNTCRKLIAAGAMVDAKDNSDRSDNFYGRIYHQLFSFALERSFSLSFFQVMS